MRSRTSNRDHRCRESVGPPHHRHSHRPPLRTGYRNRLKRWKPRRRCAHRPRDGPSPLRWTTQSRESGGDRPVPSGVPRRAGHRSRLHRRHQSDRRRRSYSSSHPVHHRHSRCAPRARDGCRCHPGAPRRIRGVAQSWPSSPHCRCDRRGRLPSWHSCGCHLHHETPPLAATGSCRPKNPAAAAGSCGRPIAARDIPTSLPR